MPVRRTPFRGRGPKQPALECESGRRRGPRPSSKVPECESTETEDRSGRRGGHASVPPVARSGVPVLLVRDNRRGAPGALRAGRPNAAVPADWVDQLPGARIPLRRRPQGGPCCGRTTWARSVPWSTRRRRPSARRPYAPAGGHRRRPAGAVQGTSGPGNVPAGGAPEGVHARTDREHLRFLARRAPDAGGGRLDSRMRLRAVPRGQRPRRSAVSVRPRRPPPPGTGRAQPLFSRAPERDRPRVPAARFPRGGVAPGCRTALRRAAQSALVVRPRDPVRRRSDQGCSVCGSGSIPTRAASRTTSRTPLGTRASWATSTRICPRAPASAMRCSRRPSSWRSSSSTARSTLPSRSSASAKCA